MKLPAEVPPLGRRTFHIIQAFWIMAFALAVVGPVLGLHDRFVNGSDNSLLMLGSRAGIVVSEQDGTKIRFPVGPATSALGIKPGDDIVAINGIAVPEVVPVSTEDLEAHSSDLAYVVFADLLYGTESSDVQLTLRSPGGQVRDVTVTTGDHHIVEAAHGLGMHASLLGFVDLLHVITYPFLLIAAWILHRRNARDVVSSILSLAILLTMGTEQPSATFLAWAGVPRPAHMFLYDTGNILLLTGILLFPHGKLSGRLIAILAALPILFFLKGDEYRALFMVFMLAAVLMLVGCLRRTAPGDLKQQIKWALFGFSGYALFLCVSLTSDMFKSLVGTFTNQLILETLAGFALGIAFLSLQLGLMVALLRYRLYDAEVVISRSASFAVVTLTLAAAFAGVMEGIIESMQNEFGDTVGTGAAVIGATMATVLIHPLHERVQAWAERRFQRNLLQLREGLPQAVRDLREVADVPEFLHELLARVQNGVRTVRAAFVINGSIADTSGASPEEASQWLRGFSPAPEGEAIETDRGDRMFPIRVRLTCGATRAPVGWLLVGPRPDGTIAGGEERHALQEIAEPIANSLRIVLKREKDEREIADLLDTHRQRLDRLEASLLPLQQRVQR